jgi:excisionase family DNA binding protein
MNEDQVKSLLSTVFVDVDVAAQVLGVTGFSIKTAIKNGQLSSIRVGKRIKVRSSSVRKLLEAV